MKIFGFLAVFVLLAVFLTFCTKMEVPKASKRLEKPKSATITPKKPKLAIIVIEAGSEYVGKDGNIEVPIPSYAFEKIQDYDFFDIVALSPNIHMYYYDKEGPNHENPGHAFAIIMDRYGRKFYLFQSTIKTDQRFFIYEGNIPMKTSKPKYRGFLKKILEEDRR